MVRIVEVDCTFWVIFWRMRLIPAISEEISASFMYFENKS